MQHKPVFKKIAAATISTLLAVASPMAWADGDTEPAKPMALRKIMQDLGRNMQTITGGISREDWALVAKIAPLVADHPQPPMDEKMRILGFVGIDAGKFKAHDGETNAQAQALGKAAKAKDGPGVILAFQKLQTSCHNCHSNFRKPFVEHFYGKKDVTQ